MKALLDTVQYKLIPAAQYSLKSGDGIFTSAILRKTDLIEVATGRDRTVTKNPTFTSELDAIEAFFKLENNIRPDPENCVFLSVFEPHPVSICNLTKAGFDNFVFLFTRETWTEFEATQISSSLFVEIFGVQQQQLKYQSSNKYWTSFSLKELIEECPENQQLVNKMDELKGMFQWMLKGTVNGEDVQTMTS